MAGLAELTNTVLDFVRLHPNWAALIVFVLAFGESLAFVSLILPFWAMLVGIGTIIGAADPLIFWTIVTAAAVGAALGEWLSYWLGFHYHEKTATRLAGHYTHSTEDKQSQPGTNGIENSQIRLTDGSVIFTPDLFGPGISVEKVTYDMVSVDGGIKKKGFSLEAEYYWRWLSDFRGTNTGGIEEIHDTGYQLQASAMVVPKALQLYAGVSQIFGERYGDASELRAGVNWYFVKERGLRFNAEWLHLNKCPVGYTAVPYPVGGNGNVFHTNLEMNF